MPSKYKNVSQEVIREAIVGLAKEDYPFQQPVLQRDTFWIYCNARRYWGRYTDALKDANVELSSELSVKSEFGHEIDWWHFQESQVQKECLGMLIDYIYKEGVDISPKGLKQSKYFDLYTDAVLLFGNYETLLEYVDIPKEEVRPHTSSEKTIDSVIKPVISLYTSDCRDHEGKCQRITEAGLSNIDVDFPSLTKGFHLCPVIVDGANVGTRINKPSLENIKLVDKYLQDNGFTRDNISFVFDASFRHKVGANQFDILSNADQRMSIAPANEQADGVILSLALRMMQKQPNYPPFIITNDKYDDFFQMHPEFRVLKPRKRGVTWAYIQKKPIPIISFTFV